MEKTVYIIGAGFSAPLGIPTMNDFLFKSKDLYAGDPSEYSHFNKVFETINRLSFTKNYYDCDLFNIEEILSIIEMNEFLKGEKLDLDFIRYIKNVIDFYTPIYPPIGKDFPENWQQWLFGKDYKYSLYGHFVSSLMGLVFERKQSDSIRTGRTYDFCAESDSLARSKYSVLSLNYDMVLENVAARIKEQYISKDPIEFNKSTYDQEWKAVHLAKLHGCLNGVEIVPPTWAKGTHPTIAPIWENAHKLLNDANHIRFIGYSLPQSDSYIKYLLKSAVIDAQNLKSIDVICLDEDGAAKSRYDEFFAFRNYRFKNASVIDYFESIKGKATPRRERRDQTVSTSLLEDAHDEFFN